MLNSNHVVVIKTETKYSLPVVEEGIKQVFDSLGFDADNRNTTEWNPLSELIKPGDSVFIKPNLVNHKNSGRDIYGLTDTDSLITHGLIIKVVLKYVGLALKGKGKVIIGDSPIQGADWNEICKLSGLVHVKEYFNTAFPGIELVIKDYRLGTSYRSLGSMKRYVNEPELCNFIEVDLKTDSLLMPLIQQISEFGVTQYSKRRLKNSHTLSTNKYLIHKDILSADVFINLAKMKSHTKAGISGALKNLVGINGHKDYLPHFRFGSPKQGGDEYPDGNWTWDKMWKFKHREWEYDSGWQKYFNAFIGKCFHGLLMLMGFPRDFANIGGGGWYGNDTLWRTVLDINRAFFYYDRQKQKIDRFIVPQTVYLVIVDGIIGGQKESPLSPTPINSGFLIAGQNPLAVDTVMASLMGFDYKKIKQIIFGYGIESLPLAHFQPEAIKINGNINAGSVDDIYKKKLFCQFEPSYGFKEQIEWKERSEF